MLRRLFPLVLVLGAAPLAAQEGVPWRASYFPYVIGNPSAGFMGVAHYHLARQADYEKRFPFDGILSAEAGYSTNNSRFASARLRAPGLIAGWRVAADLGAFRESTFGYFGEGADGSNRNFAPGPAFDDGFFQVGRTRYLVRAEVTRKIAGPFSAALGAGVTHSRYAAREDGSLFNTDYLHSDVLTGNAPATGTDATGRLTLVLDTRDDELVTTQGLLFEAGAYAGSDHAPFKSLPVAADAPPGTPTYELIAGGGYTGAYAHLRGYVAPREGTVLAVRVATRALSERAPLDARNTLPGWERDITVLGGAESHRSFVAGRFSGRGLLFGSVEIRQNLIDVGDYGAVTLLAFADGGRAFGQDGFRVTLSGWQVGGGGGVALRILQSSPLVLNFAGGPDGFRFTMGNGFAF